MAMCGGVKLPPDLDLQRKNAYADWKFWEFEFEVVLFVDNCLAHPVVTLRHVEVVFLPPNTTSVLQPLDQGIFRQVKPHFRTMMVQYLLQKVDMGKEMVKWNVFDTTHAFTVAWEK
ncbi:hypothetical protein PR048_008742 [Dryococelus australis]|uniref:DDE-1 domain-containing protein n=1 Tax=Dryococelus australis TaxID=614101 RepID=A0ABQ9HY03_9NEOP|nr:hypothetical protein PR048_008742 [Dryococelus australis]